MRTKATLLEVFINYEESNILVSEITASSEDWSKSIVYLGKRQTPLHLAFESRPSEAEEVIAIDDFSMVDCQPPAPSPDECRTNDFKCRNGKHVFTEMLINHYAFKTCASASTWYAMELTIVGTTLTRLTALNICQSALLNLTVLGSILRIPHIGKCNIKLLCQHI